MPLLAEHENLVVLRTFSKAMSWPALRRRLWPTRLVREIDKARLPTASTSSQVGCSKKGEMEANVLRLRRLRDALFADLQRSAGSRLSRVPTSS